MTNKNSSTLNNTFQRLLISEYFILFLSAIFFVVIGIMNHQMFTINSITNIISNMWPLLAACLGQTLVLLLGGIDLSQTAVISFCSMTSGLLLSGKFDALKFKAAPVWENIISEKGGLFSSLPQVPAALLGVIVVLIVGTLMGLVNGLFIAKLGMPPFMTTLISQMFWSAIALWIVVSQNCTQLNKTFCFIGDGKIVGVITMPLIIVILLLIFVELLLSRSIIGRWIYSVGSNKKASVISGIPAEKITIFVYSMSGFFAAMASIMYTGRQMMGRPTLGTGMLNDILGATVIGGISMYGGKGKARWALYGVIFYCIMTTSMNMLRLNSFVIEVVKGCVILFAVSLDIIRSTMQKRMTV